MNSLLPSAFPKLAGIVIFWFAALLLHLAAGMYFPQPFGDESYFFFMARSWAENQSFFSPELHSNRTLYWMPLGYPFFAGLVLKWVSPHFIWLRHFSFLGISAAYLAICLYWFRAKDAGLKIVLTGLFLLSKPWLICGNLGRMESWVLACLALGIYLYHLGYSRISWLFTFMAGAFHPIGLAFIPFRALFPVLLSGSWQLRDFLIAALLFLPAGIFFYLGFPPESRFLVQDWQFQMAGKTPEGLEILLLRPRTLGFFLLAGFLAFQFRRQQNRQNLFLTSLAVWLFLIRIYGRGETYGIYTSLAMLLLSVCLWDYLSSLSSRPKKWLLFSGLMVFLFGTRTLHLPLWGPDPSVSFEEIMKNRQYLKEEELKAIREKADSVCRANHWKTLAIYPETVGCLLYRKGLNFRQIIHNFEDTRPDGILFFSAEGDSFGADRNQIYEAYMVNPETQIALDIANWSMFPNIQKCKVRNRADALKRCREAGIACPD